MSMKTFKSWKWMFRKRSVLSDGGPHGAHVFRMSQFTFMAVVLMMLFIVYRITSYQYEQTEIDARRQPFDSVEHFSTIELDGLPYGILQQERSDLELKPLWSSSKVKHVSFGLAAIKMLLYAALFFAVNFIAIPPSTYICFATNLTFRYQLDVSSSHNLLAIAVGIKQKKIVDSMVQKFLAENFTIVLFHYDGKMNGWWDLDWSNVAIHITAHNQTKWWFAKRFLHPDVVSIYDYIFLWDEDLGVDHFHPGRYLKIVRSEGLQISQPALDRNSTEIHHRITIRKKAKKVVVHRRIFGRKGVIRCISSSTGPPCTGFVEGMAPVFSKSAWRCTWHLIQNDLVHGWGLDMKLGYCAQGDRTQKVGIVDSEYVFHQGIPSLGGPSAKKSNKKQDHQKNRSSSSGVDVRVEVRRQSTLELKTFKERWDKAVKEDESWVDPYAKTSWFNPFSRIGISREG